MSAKPTPPDDRPCLILVRDPKTADKWFDVACFDGRRGWVFYEDSLTFERGGTVERWRYCHEAIQ